MSKSPGAVHERKHLVGCPVPIHVFKFDCERVTVVGQALWGWAKSKYSIQRVVF